MVFRTLREVGRQVRDSVVENIQQQQQRQQYSQQQQQQYSQQQWPHQQWSPLTAAMNPNPQPWPLLVLPSQTPSPLFAALLDAIFTLSLPADSSNNLDLLTPTRLAAVYDELGYPAADNLPFLLRQRAQANGHADTKPHVNDAMKMAWRIFALEHTDATAPDGRTITGLTRQGFKDLFVRDALIYPVGQAAAWNGMVAKHRGALVGMGLVLPAAAMGPEVFMPRGVGPTGDAQVQARYKEGEQRWGEEYRMRFGQSQEQGQGMDIGMAMQMENWRHGMMMDAIDALSPGYRVYYRYP